MTHSEWIKNAAIVLHTYVAFIDDYCMESYSSGGVQPFTKIKNQSEKLLEDLCDLISPEIKQLDELVPLIKDILERLPKKTI